MRVVVAGVNGFRGNRLAGRMAKRGHAVDAVEAAVKAGDLAANGGCGIMNCGSGVSASSDELVAMLNAAPGPTRTPRTVPELTGHLGAVVLDVALTKARSAWHPRPVRTGLTDSLVSGECH